MPIHWTRKLLTALLVVMTFAAVIHAAAEIDPCLLNGTQHTGRHAEHSCPACSSVWMSGPSAPAVAPAQTIASFVWAADVSPLAPDHSLVPSPRGPPSFRNS
ncbi:MAG: hypothetical protein O3A53_18295 [Acidobacteria bacterium]|nr:hypothetical protein [Acidobacteriota bacterium]